MFFVTCLVCNIMITGPLEFQLITATATRLIFPDNIVVTKCGQEQAVILIIKCDISWFTNGPIMFGKTLFGGHWGFYFDVQCFHNWMIDDNYKNKKSQVHTALGELHT